MNTNPDVHHIYDDPGQPTPGAPVMWFAGVGATAGLAVPILAWGLTGTFGSWMAIAGLAFYLLALTIAGRSFRRNYPHEVLGLCNVVTITRLALVAVLFGALFDSTLPVPQLLVIASVAFALDGADGWFARRAGLTSGFGARFDVEVDSAFALILAGLAVEGGLHPLVFLLGLPRYAFGLAQMLDPRLNGQLSDRFSRKVVCVVQIAILIALIVPWFDTDLRHVAAFFCAMLVAWSFAIDIRALLKAAV